MKLDTRTALAIAATCMLTAWSAPAPALDPALDVSQYGHVAWRIRDGFSKGSDLRRSRQTADGYLWLRHRVRSCCASMAFEAFHGGPQPGALPTTTYCLCLPRATDSPDRHVGGTRKLEEWQGDRLPPFGWRLYQCADRGSGRNRMGRCYGAKVGTAVRNSGRDNRMPWRRWKPRHRHRQFVRGQQRRPVGLRAGSRMALEARRAQGVFASRASFGAANVERGVKRRDPGHHTEWHPTDCRRQDRAVCTSGGAATPHTPLTVSRW